MEHSAAVVSEYGSARRSGIQILLVAVLCAIVVVHGIVLYATRHVPLGDRLDTAGTLLTTDALLFAAWQWRRQRLELALEVYFTRLDSPNVRRLQYFERQLALGTALGVADAALALEQHYVFYVYAELDNLWYALTKYVERDMSAEVAERAVLTFETRCRQSRDFRTMAVRLVLRSGYPARFEDLVRQLASHAEQLPPLADGHPMQFEELAVVRGLRASL